MRVSDGRHGHRVERSAGCSTTQTVAARSGPARGSLEGGSRQLTANIAPVERFGRIVLGTAAGIAGTVLLTVAGSVVGAILELLVILAGIDLLVTGALGHSEFYRIWAERRVRPASNETM